MNLYKHTKGSPNLDYQNSGPLTHPPVFVNNLAIENFSLLNFGAIHSGSKEGSNHYCIPSNVFPLKPTPSAECSPARCVYTNIRRIQQKQNEKSFVNIWNCLSLQGRRDDCVTQPLDLYWLYWLRQSLHDKWDLISCRRRLASILKSWENFKSAMASRTALLGSLLVTWLIVNCTKQWWGFGTIGE